MIEAGAIRQQSEQKLKVFISYSRKDEAFAEETLAALEACGFAPYLDKHDIAPGEPWEERLGRLILESDTVAFVISPDSIASDRCAWEIAKTEELGKRLLPIVWRRVEEELVPERLKRLNYIFFDGQSFGVALRTLAAALNTDLDWIREHTRLGELALRWHSRGRAEPLLIRGHDIDDAKSWMARRPKGAPEPTDLQRAFVQASEKQERETRERSAAQEAALKSAELQRERLARERAEDAVKAAEALAVAARRTTRRTFIGLAASLIMFAAAAVLGWMTLVQQRKTVELERTASEERAVAAESLGETSRTLLELGDTAKALESAGEALRLSQALLAKHPGDPAQQRDVAVSFLRQGDVRRAIGARADALQAYDQALEIQERVLGADHPDIAQSLNRKASLLVLLGRYAEAEPLQRRALQIREKAIGGNHPYVAKSLEELAGVYLVLARLGDSEALQKRALAIREASFGPGDPEVARSINALGETSRAQGRLQEAEDLFKRALEIFEKAWGSEHAYVATCLNNLGVVYVIQERLEDAEPIYRRALAIREKALGPEHPDVGVSATNIAALYKEQGRYPEAEHYYRRALTIRERALGAEHPDVGRSLTEIASLYRDQQQHDLAEPLYRRSLTILEKSFGPEHPDVGQTLRELAALFEARGRPEEAEPLLRRSLANLELALGPHHPSVALLLNDLGKLQLAQGRNAEAQPLLERALGVADRALGSEHASVVGPLRNLAALHQSAREWGKAHAYYSRAADVISKKSQRQFQGDRNVAARGLLTQYRDVFIGSVEAAWGLSLDAPARRAALAEQAFQAVQWPNQTTAGAAVEQLAARFAAGEGPLAALVRERQDLRNELQVIERQLVAILSDVSGRSNRETLTAQAAAHAARLSEIDAKLSKEFPDFLAISAPRPVSMAESAALLAPDEALVQFVFAEQEGFLWLVTKVDQRWVRIAAGTKVVGDIATNLRCVLDQVTSGVACGNSGGKHDNGFQRFDVTRAHALHSQLFGPVEDLIRDKHLLIVPSQPLTTLPFGVLVTELPRLDREFPLSAYPSLSWLGLRNPITVLPSLASLRALRKYAKASRATKPYIGIGNPLLDGPYASPTARLAREKQSCGLPTKTGMTTNPAAPASVAPPSAAKVDLEELRRFPPLPETADEICAVGKSVGASEADIHLGGRATEASIKALSARGELSNYRIIHFATHGFNGGDIPGIPEAGLVLTPPAQLQEDDDGVLLTSEISVLKLDADWVILSAGAESREKSPDEAFAGVTRALFYAGARAVLVSYFELQSEAAVKLVTTAIAEMQSSPSIGRAEALRRSTAALVASGGASSHPGVWAPFIVVGEGGR